MDFKWINKVWPLMIVLFVGNFASGYVTNFFGWSTSQGWFGAILCYAVLAIIVLKLQKYLGLGFMSGDMDGS